MTEAAKLSEREQIANLIFKSVEPILAEISEPNPEDYLPAADAILALRSSSDPDAMRALEDDLAQRCKEVLDWHATGLLNGGKGGALRALAERLKEKVSEHYALDLAEKQTADEAMKVVAARCCSPAETVGLQRSSQADAYFKILRTIATFPITDPGNMDAQNMRLIAEGAIALTSKRPLSNQEGGK